MKKLFFILLIVSTLVEISIGQTNYLKLINRANENKIKIIKAEPFIDFTIEYQADIDSSRQIRTLIYKTGHLIEVTNDSIKLKVTDYDIITYYKDSTSYFTDTISISKKDISKIVTSKHGGNPFVTIGTLSLISALVVSPLISIDYDDFQTNTNKYFRVSGFSSLISIISFSLIATTNNHFWILNDKKPTRRLWRLG